MTDENEDPAAIEAVEEEEAEVERHSTRTFVAGLAIGALVGAGLALLFAPQSGVETRRAVSRRAKHLAREARDRYEEMREKVRRARREKERGPEASDG